MNRKVPILLILTACFFTSAFAQSERTTRRGLKVRAVAPTAVEAAPGDTLRFPSADDVRISGFDKPLRSRFETMFVTNCRLSTITAVCFIIDYTDPSGRQLHQSIRTVHCDIPPGETRQLKFSTWDAQSAFYYVVTGKPRRSEGSPFDIRCRINYVVTSTDSDGTPD